MGVVAFSIVLCVVRSMKCTLLLAGLYVHLGGHFSMCYSVTITWDPMVLVFILNDWVIVWTLSDSTRL